MMVTDFGKAVRKARIEADVTLTAMAATMGISATFLSTLETGKRKVSAVWVAKIQAYFNARGIALPNLPELADLVNKSISLVGLPLMQQYIMARLARTSLNDDQLAQIMALLESNQ